ncbi:MAG: hypothetical protein COV74_00655 [Candidatus Omnitrophica bacterium CG11_big_fil_rev_8_21_14_0_20_45_26]|uniref:Right handed beta helix domain-containing protein n=1 Tax=Candidatus Abzuiibacterium crystallinum TaxID=1974748 RepID=A0A2H0LSV4_9BACT|nr:MAG: hypothetical protein COV74_00655 [Candidatus Omnitrophica bacterium CG11_big_fil_rev_8_21_14_0_20_45_26]
MPDQKNFQVTFASAPTAAWDQTHLGLIPGHKTTRLQTRKLALGLKPKIQFTNLDPGPLTLFKIILVTCALSLVTMAAPSALAETIWPGGDITQNTPWLLSGSPYIVQGTVTVRNNAILTIEAGVEVRVEPLLGIEIRIGTDTENGTVVADGNDQANIRFTSNAAQPEPGDWSGLRLDMGAQPASLLNYVMIEYGSDPGLEVINGGRVTMTNTTIQLASGKAVSAYSVFETQSFGAGNSYLNNGENVIEWTKTDLTTFSSNHTIPYQSVPYVTNGSLQVSSGTTLTIEAGVEVKFEDFDFLRIQGILNSQGTQGNEVRFTSNKPTPQPGDWNGLLLLTGDSYTLSHVIVEYSKNGFDISNSPNLTLSDCISQNNSDYGFKLAYANNLTQVTALNNTTNFWFWGSAATATLTGVTSSGGTNGFSFEIGAAPVITEATVTNNTYGFYIMGAGPYANPNPTVHQSSIYDNTAYNVYVQGNFQDPNATLNFEENWWGTVEESEIEMKIYDHSDDPFSPYVDYFPYLTENGEKALAFYDISRDPSTVDHKRGEPISILYSLTVDAAVTIEIYDDLTQELVKTLIADALRFEGPNIDEWDGKNDLGELLPYEAYYFKIIATAGEQMKEYEDPLGHIPVGYDFQTENVDFDPHKNQQFVVHYGMDHSGRLPVEIVYQNTNNTIRTLVGDEPRDGGQMTEFWDGRDNAGNIRTGGYDARIVNGIAVHENSLILADSFVKPFAERKSEAYLILPNYSEVSTIQYNLTVPANITITIEDPNGNYFKTLVSEEYQTEGLHETVWDGTNDVGERTYLEGVYKIVILASDPGTESMHNTVVNVNVFE